MELILELESNARELIFASVPKIVLVTYINQNWTFCTLELQFSKNIWANRLFNTKDTSLSHTNLVASRHIKREESSLPVDVLHSKMLLLELPIINNLNQMPGKHPQVFQSLNYPFDAKKSTFSQPKAKTNEA